MLLLIVSAWASAVQSVGAAEIVNLAEVDARLTRAYQECPGFKSAVDPEMLDCVSAEIEIQDKRLNLIYNKVFAALETTEQGKLRKAQRAWLAYRDQWCGLIYDGSQGSLDRIEANECILKETILQTIRIENLAVYSLIIMKP